MKLPVSHNEVMQNLSQYLILHGTEIPEYQRNRIVQVMGPGNSSITYLTRAAEALYAVADQLNPEGREIAAQAANICAMYNWHGMIERGSRMVNALRRMNGEETGQLEDLDPKPLARELVPPLPSDDEE